MKLEWKTCFKLGVTVVAIFLVIHYWSAVSGFAALAIGAAVPLFLGCAIAYVANILMNFYEKYFVIICKKSKIIKLKRPLCMLLAFLSVILVIVVIAQMIIPELIACVTMLVEKLPDALSNAYIWLEDKFEISRYVPDGLEILKNPDIDWESMVKSFAGIVMNGVSGAMDSIFSIVSSVFSTLVTVLLGLIFSIYILASKEKLLVNFKQVVHTYLSEKRESQFIYVVRTLNHSFHSFIVGQCLEAVILGALCVIGMLIFQFPYASMIGCLIGFTALIPVAGAYIGAAIGAFMIFTVSPFQALMFLIFLVILQQVEGNLIYPRVVGSSIGLPGIWVLAAVTIGGGVMGVGGMLLGVPLAATAYQLLRRDMKHRNAKEEKAEKKVEKKVEKK